LPPESLTPQSLETFRKSPNYNLNEYIEPSPFLPG
jgi:hypothetical protein